MPGARETLPPLSTWTAKTPMQHYESNGNISADGGSEPDQLAAARLEHDTSVQ